MELTEWIRLVATPRDRALLEELSRRNGDAGMSATVRRLIREEAARVGIETKEGVETEQEPVGV